jgi:endonuclease/exonuclease/phosphatase family metal-dependent hydrolase
MWEPLLRLCTWNINLGRRLDEILDAIGRHPDFTGLDLFALQEASEHDGSRDAEAIAAAMGAEYGFHQVAAQTVRGRVQANAMIWHRQRVHVQRSDHLRLQTAGARSDRRPRVLPRGLTRQERNSVVIEAIFERLSVLAYSVHLDILGFQHKVEQASLLFADRRTRPAADVTIVAGDLNTFHLSRWPSWAKLAEAFRGEGFEDTGSDVRWTHSVPGLHLRQKLDSILVHSNVRCEHRSWTLPISASDHLPLFTDIDFSEQPATPS